MPQSPSCQDVHVDGLINNQKIKKKKIKDISIKYEEVYDTLISLGERVIIFNALNPIMNTRYLSKADKGLDKFFKNNHPKWSLGKATESAKKREAYYNLLTSMNKNAKIRSNMIKPEILRKIK